jgi:Zn-dependent M16 (insulinase) family peptidase
MGSYDNGILQPIFSVVAKNANVDQKEAFVKTIEDCLKKIVSEGIDKQALEAGINYHEFRFREADFGNYPKGLMYYLQMLDSWLYDDAKPFIHLQAIETFEFLKQQIGTRYYEELIQKYLLDNTHASLVVVKPEKGRTARLDRELEERLQQYKKQLSEQEIESLVQKTYALVEYQESEETKEDMEKIPVLAREDISREVAPIYNEEQKVGQVPLVYHEIETNGIGYLTLMFDLSGIPEEKLPYAGLLQSVLGLIDTTNYEYGALFNEINVHTGGIGTSLEFYADVTKVKEKEFRATFEIKGKALYPKMDILGKMMREILMESKLDDTKRLKEILAMLKSRLQMSFQSSGHTTAALRALSYDSPLAKFKDDVDGIGFYEVVREIEEHFEERKDELIANLKEIATNLFRADAMMVSYTASKDGLEAGHKVVSDLAGGLHTEPRGKETPCVIHCKKRNEGFKTSSKVQYVARVGNFIDHGAEYQGALQILKVILSYDYLWQNVRVKGGAYGCMSSFNRLGEGYFISYRDPNLKKTLDVYDGIVDYLKHFTVDERDMNKYVIGTMSNIDRPMTPASKGERSMNLYMNHVSEEMLMKERSRILNATVEDIRSLAGVVEAILAADQLCVIGSEEKIEEQKELFKEVKTLF